jgi:hypothetical protein
MTQSRHGQTFYWHRH